MKYYIGDFVRGNSKGNNNLKLVNSSLFQAEVETIFEGKKERLVGIRVINHKNKDYINRKVVVGESYLTLYSPSILRFQRNKKLKGMEI
jgi:hypothetical protein